MDKNWYFCASVLEFDKNIGIVPHPKRPIQPKVKMYLYKKVKEEESVFIIALLLVLDLNCNNMRHSYFFFRTAVIFGLSDI